jgi:hypothetical protein
MFENKDPTISDMNRTRETVSSSRTRPAAKERHYMVKRL